MRTHRPGLVVFVLGLFVLLAVGLNLIAGTRWLSIEALLWGWNDPDVSILLGLRLKRCIMALAVGGGLSVSGAVFQALLRNPLADPFIVGVSGGAAVGGTLAMLPLAMSGVLAASLSRSGLVFAGSFAGALAATAFLYSLSRVRGQLATNHLLLLGVVFNFFASSVVMFLKTVLTGSRLQEVLFWLMGTLASEAVSWDLVWTCAATCVASVAILSFWSGQLNILAVGEEFAHGSGISPERLKRRLFLLSSFLVASAVAISGFVGFVGLVVPHMVRLLVGADHRLVVPGSAMAGASFLLLCDLAARLAVPLASTHLPVGLVTSLVGGPLFIFLLVRAQRKGEWQ